MKQIKLRFPEFVDDWKPYKVSEITNFHKQGFYTTEEYCNDKKYYLLRGTDLSNNRLQLNDTPKINATEKDYQAFKVKTGDFLVVRSGTVGTYGIVYQEIPAIFGSYLINFRFDHSKVKNEFFGYFYQSDLFKRQLNKIIQQSANTNINAENIKSTIIQLPSLNEQEKISTLLNNLDNLIQSVEKELEGDRELKQCMLQKMFPKKGETVPEIRFPEFNGEWEEHKLGDIATFINGRAYSQNELLDCGKYKVLRVGNFYTNDSWYYSDMELDDKYYAEKGDLLYTWSATFGPHIWDGERVIYHYHIWKVELSDSLEKLFAVQLLENDKQSIISDKNGSTMVHITKKGMENKFVMLPSSIEEQIKIGKLFQQIENLIASQQQELDGYKELKKGLLQQMFC